MNLATVFHRYNMHGVPQMTLVLLVVKRDQVISDFLHWIKHTQSPELAFVYQNRIVAHILKVYHPSEYTTTTDSALMSGVPQGSLPDIPPKSLPETALKTNITVVSEKRVRLSGKCLASFPIELLTSVLKSYPTDKLCEYCEYLMRSRLDNLSHFDRVYFTLCFILQNQGPLVHEFRRSIAGNPVIHSIRHDQNSYIFAFAEYLCSRPKAKSASGRGREMRNFLLS